MATYKYFEASAPSVRQRVIWPTLLALALVSLTYLIPLLNSTTPPYFELTSTIASVAVWLSNSASLYGATVLAVVLIAVFATRARLSQEYRLKEALLIAGATLLFAGGGALVNEHWVKKKFDLPRPNIEWLAQQGDAGFLGMSATDFYSQYNKKQRREPLARALDVSSLPMTDSVRKHWIQETGYSFPSGHSFTAFFFATFFLFLASTFIENRRGIIYFLLIPWAVSVSLSRLVLRVHTPLDISIGALEGVILGFIAFVVVRMIIRLLVLAEIRG